MEKIDEIYNFIGSELIKSIDGSWSTIEFEIEAYLNDYVQFSGRYFTPEGEKKGISTRALPVFELKEAVYSLLNIMTAEGKNRWNKALFKVASNNSFEINFMWDQGLDDSLQES